MTISSIPLPPVAVHGFDGVAVTPHTLATQAAMSILDQGGNAVDAAIAANAVQGTVAPETCGVGGDLFALVIGPGVSGPGLGIPLALNSSGRAGSNANAADLRRSGLEVIPQRHPAAVTAPGCVDGWMALSEKLGSLALDRVLGPAIRLAAEGFPASREMAAAFTDRAEELRNETAARPVYGSGDQVRDGARIRRPSLADTFRRIATDGRAGFYEGPVARAISDAVEGSLTTADLARDHAEWVVPISVDVFDRTAWTVPPNSLGYVAVAALGILERLGLAEADDPLAWHRVIEAYRAAAADTTRLVADPVAMDVDPAQLVDPAALDRMADLVDDDTVVSRSHPAEASGGTAYLCVVDGDGMGVSLIQSNFHGIGSGISAGAHGFMLHDRGRGFTLEPGHPNELTPGRRPLHTLSPTIWTRSGRLDMVLGTRGGWSQPQLLAQLGSNIAGRSMTPAPAQARPRWEVAVANSGSEVRVEPGTPESVVDGLRRRGHQVARVEAPMAGWGPMSVITIGDDGLRTGAADPRVATATAMAR